MIIMGWLVQTIIPIDSFPIYKCVCLDPNYFFKKKKKDRFLQNQIYEIR